MIQPAEKIQVRPEADQNQSDEVIVLRIKAGEGELFVHLYDRYYAKVFRLAFGMTAEREQADDLAQDIFLRVYRQIDAFRMDSTFATWFYRIAFNHCLTYLRRQRWRRLMVTTSDLPNVHEVGDDQPRNLADASLLKQEIQSEVRRALLSLKPKARLFVFLKDIEGLSYDEIAEQLDCSPGTVASGLSRARHLLARKLAPLKGKI